MNVFEEAKRFGTDRGIDKVSPTKEDYTANILEELLEFNNISVPNKNRKKLKTLVSKINQYVVNADIGTTTQEIEYSNIDAICDVIVFSITELMKYGIDPEKALLETFKEVNSRVGTMIDGKFIKDTSVKAQANWYKADYSTCVI